MATRNPDDKEHVRDAKHASHQGIMGTGCWSIRGPITCLVWLPSRVHRLQSVN